MNIIADYSSLSPPERDVLDAVDEAALVRDLQDLVRIPSLDGDETAAQERVAALMARNGLSIDRWSIDMDQVRSHPSFSAEADRRDALGIVGIVGGAGNGGRDLILNAHIDVVPAGEEARWTYGPWAGELAGGYVWGRGALDDKGGIVCALHAASALLKAGARLAGRLLVESVVGEEDGGTGTLAAVLRGHTADAAIVVEPTALAVVPAQAGALNFRLAVEGRAAHGCVREEGVSAFEKFLPLHEALLDLEQRRNERVKVADAASPRPLFGGHRLPIPLSIGVVQAGEWASTVPELLHSQGRYGVAVGESLPAARAELEAAVAAAADADEWLREHRPRVEWWGGQFAPAQTPLDSPVVNVLLDAGAAVCGRDLSIEGVTYGADMRLLVNDGGIPTVLFGPGDVKLAHRPDERVPVEQLVQATRTLALAALRFCGYD